MRISSRDYGVAVFLFLGAAVVSQAIRFILLPDKFFIDSMKILGGMNYPGTLQGSYGVTADAFHLLNLFHAETLLEWAIVIAIPYNLFFSFYLPYRIQSRKIEVILYALFSSAIMNIFVFQLSKEVIQVSFFLLIHGVIRNNRLRFGTKLLHCLLLLFLLGLVFRTYYIIIACYTLMAHVVILFLWNQPHRKKRILLLFLTLSLGVLLSMLLVRTFLYEQYLEIILVRNRLTLSRIGKQNAQTLILNLLPYQGDNILLFSGNYVINLFRMLLPLELLMDGIYYIPFVFYQLLITLRLLFVSRRMQYGSPQYLAFVLLVGYFLGSALFEPDFGSYLRHLAAATPITMLLFQNDNHADGSEKREGV